MIETLKDRRSLVQASLWFLSLSLALFGIWRYWQAQGDRSYVVDEAVYTYVGWSWGQNYWPYVESWDHKGPLVYATTMLRTKIADTNAEALAGQEIVLGTVTALLLAGIAHQLWGGTGAALALALSILLWSQKPPEHGHMSTPGSLITLFTSGAILASLYSARRASFRSMAVLAVVMGVSIGMAVSTKPNALTGLAVGLGVLWWIPRGLQSSRRLMLTLSSLVGAAVPPLAVAAAFYRVGALGELVDNYLVYNTVRGKLILQNGIPTLAISTLKSLNHVDILPLMVAFPAAVILALIYRRSTAQKGEQPSYVGAVIALSWLVLDLGLVVSSGGYRHQVYTVFPAAALGGVWLIQAAARGSDLSSRSLPLVIFLLLFVPLVLSAGSMRPPFDTAGSRSPEWDRVVSALEETTGPDDSVFTLENWQGPSLLVSAHRRNASRYTYPVPMYTQGYVSDARWNEILEEMRDGDPPEIVLVSLAGLEVPPGEAVTVDLLMDRFDDPWIPPFLVDPSEYPHRERLKSFISGHYRLENCLAGLCLLRHLGTTG